MTTVIKILKSVIKIVTMTSLIVFSFLFGQAHGYNVGVTAMGRIAGPALYQCVHILGGQITRTGQ